MNPNTNKQVYSFRKISFLTVIAVYFLILVGGIVRTTGSGMGCPDWPKCFGSVIPPTSVEQLPDNYQDIYLQKRIAKNERFVATLEKLGFSETANQIANDKSILVEQEFNPVKTWIEYINRLIGVLIGFFIILTVWRSLPLWKMDKWIPILSVAALVLVLFQGWIGSLVVSTNLLHWMITFHMMLAILQVLLLIYLYHRSGNLQAGDGVEMDVPSKIEWVLISALVLMLIQVVLGTQVREEIDQISDSLGNMMRGTWIEQLGIPFIIHRSFSLILLGIHLLYFFWAFKYVLRKSSITWLTQLLMIMVILEIASGIGMAYFAIPAFLQPLHLLFGTLIVGVQYLLILQLREHRQYRLKIN
ncbi:COX15/CtaA family protein [Algoriphagus aestuarii]|nr:COX15/CtaA family protein [Algoriphagus aestuarii]